MGRRPRLPKYISRTPHGFLVQLRLHGVPHRQRFRRDTPESVMTNWIAMIQKRYGGSTAPGLFPADARRYLETVKAMPTYLQRKQHIEEWETVFRDRYRDTITSDEIRAQLHRWRTEPRDVPMRTRPGAPPQTRRLVLSAAAVNKRRTALAHLYTVLDGKSARNPVKDVPKFREPAPAPKAIPYDTIRAIFAAMPESKAKARLMVLAYTGLPQAQIAQIHPTDVDLDGRTVAVTGRRKGAGTQGWIVPLTADGARALQMMAREDAWGTFSNTVLRRAFQRACKAIGLKGTFVPYDLRHSFGTEVYRSSGDIRATQVLMGHSTPQLTHRYTLAAVDPRIAEAVRAFGRERK